QSRCASVGVLFRRAPRCCARSVRPLPLSNLLYRQHHSRRPAVLRLVEPTAGGNQRRRQEGSTRNLRPARPRDGRNKRAPPTSCCLASLKLSSTTSTERKSACSSKAPAPGASCRASSIT